MILMIESLDFKVRLILAFMMIKFFFLFVFPFKLLMLWFGNLVYGGLNIFVIVVILTEFQIFK